MQNIYKRAQNIQKHTIKTIRMSHDKTLQRSKKALKGNVKQLE